METKFPLCNHASGELELSQFEHDTLGMPEGHGRVKKPVWSLTLQPP